MASFINVSSFSNRYLIEVSNIQLTLKAGTIDGKLGSSSPQKLCQHLSCALQVHDEAEVRQPGSGQTMTTSNHPKMLQLLGFS